MFGVRVIKTPTDFEPTINSYSYTIHKLFQVPPDIEPAIRHILDAIFNDLPYISSDEPGLIATYLDAITEPLVKLIEFELQLGAVNTTGKMNIPAGTLDSEEDIEVPWTQTHYFIAINPCFYRPSGDDHVHILGVKCQGERTLLLEGTEIRHWASHESVEQAFEGIVPWCDTCFLHLNPDPRL